MNDSVDVEGRKRLQATLAELRSFLGSKVHSLFVTQNQAEVDSLTSTILDPNVTRRSELLLLKGELAVRRAYVTLFEDAAATLEDRIQALLDSENEMLQNQNQE